MRYVSEVIMKIIMLITTILVGVLAFVFYRSPRLRETVVFLGTSLGVGAGILAAFSAVIQLRDSTEQNRLALLHRKQEAAFNYLREWQALPLVTARQLMHDSRGKPPEEIHKMLKANSAFHQAAEQIINYFEVLGLAVERGYADEAVLCSLLSDSSLGYHEVLVTWLRWYREMRKMPRLVYHYEWLIERWRNGCPAPST